MDKRQTNVIKVTLHLPGKAIWKHIYDINYVQTVEQNQTNATYWQANNCVLLCVFGPNMPSGPFSMNQKMILHICPKLAHI